MATYSLSNLRTQIKNLLTAITDIQFVSATKTSKIQGYPAVIFDITDENNKVLDSGNNERVVIFTLWVICTIGDLNDTNILNATNLLDNISQEVVNVLESKANLGMGGYSDWVTPTSGQRQQVQTPDGNIFYKEIKLECHIGVSIT